MRKSIIDYLVKVGSVGTDAYKGELELLIRQAKDAAAAAEKIDKKEAWDVGMLDQLERMRRNTLALPTLLSMAKDAAEYSKRGAVAILQAIEKQEKKKREVFKTERVKDVRHQQYIRRKKKIAEKNNIEHIKD